MRVHRAKFMAALEIGCALVLAVCEFGDVSRSEPSPFLSNGWLYLHVCPGLNFTSLGSLWLNQRFSFSERPTEL